MTATDEPLPTTPEEVSPTVRKRVRVFHWGRNLLAMVGLVAILGVAYGTLYTHLFFKNGGTDYTQIIEAPLKGENEEGALMGFVYPESFINAQLPMVPPFTSERVYSSTLALDNPYQRVIVFGSVGKVEAKEEIATALKWLSTEANYRCEPVPNFYKKHSTSEAKLVSLDACTRSLNKREAALAEAKEVTTYYYSFALDGNHLTVQVMWPGTPASANGEAVKTMMEKFKWMS